MRDIQISRGTESILRLREWLDEIGASRVLLVTGGGSFESSGARDLLNRALSGLFVSRFCDFDPNPEVSDILAGLVVWEECLPDVIVAVGGGSVMDVAKLLKAFHQDSGKIREVLRDGGSIDSSGIPLFAIPTTAGSGSEATHFAVVYDGDVKFSVADASLLPVHVFLVPELLSSLGRYTMAASGADAVCQAIESYWSIHSTDESRQFARDALKEVFGALKDALELRTPNSLVRLMDGAHGAGQAINLTKTTAPHAVSYAFTTQFGVCHGHAVSLILPSILRYNAEVSEADTLDARGANFVRERLVEIAHLLGTESAKEAADLLDDWFADCGLCRKLSEVGLRSEHDVDRIVKHGFNPQRVNNNPRKLTAGALKRMLMELL